jgi:hypothetical protein
MKNNIHNWTISGLTGLGAATVPETILSLGQKIFVGVMIAVVTSLTMRLIDKFWKRPTHHHKPRR